MPVINVRPSLPLLMGFALAALPLQSARAEPTVDLHRPVAHSGAIRVENIAGSVRVVGWDKDELAVAGTLGAGVEKVDISGDPEHLRVKVVLDHHTNDGHADLVVHLPAGSAVKVETVSASVEASGLAASIEVVSTSGDVRCDSHLRQATVKTTSGDIKISGVSEKARLESVSGDVGLHGSTGEASISTVSGDVEVGGNRFAGATVSSVSGSLTFAGGLETRGAYKLESKSGDVALLLPKDTSASLDISTFSGDIGSDFGEASADKGGHGPGHAAHISIGEGSARVDVKSFSGSVHIKKQG